MSRPCPFLPSFTFSLSRLLSPSSPFSSTRRACLLRPISNLFTTTSIKAKDLDPAAVKKGMNLQNEPSSTVSQTSFTTLALVGCRVAQSQSLYLEFFPVDGKMGPGAAERPLASIFPPQDFASVCKCNVQSYLLSMLSVNNAKHFHLTIEET